MGSPFACFSYIYFAFIETMLLYAEFAYLVPVLVYFLPTEMLTYAPPSMTVTPFSATAKSAENESSMTSTSAQVRKKRTIEKKSLLW